MTLTDHIAGMLYGPMSRPTARDYAERIAKVVTPAFDAMEPAQEALATQFCQEIAGSEGQPPSPPDPVRLLEMAEQLYKAEMDSRT